MSGLASGNGFSVTRTQSFTDVQTNALSADNANVANNERVSNNATDKGSILMGGSDALFNSKALAPLTANGETQNQTINVSTITAFQEYSLGTQYKAGKNTFRYCSFAASTAVPVNSLMQSVAPPGGGAGLANAQTAIALAAASPMAVGDTTVSVTLDAGAATTVGSMAGSTLSVEDGGAASTGGNYLIIGNTAALGGATCVLTLDPNTPVVLAVAVATSSLNIVANPYANAVQTPITTITAPLIGIYQGVDDGTNTTPFGWVQTGGNATAISAANTVALLTGEDVGVLNGASVVGSVAAQATSATDYSTKFIIVGTYAGVDAASIATLEGIPIKLSGRIPL